MDRSSSLQHLLQAVTPADLCLLSDGLGIRHRTWNQCVTRQIEHVLEHWTVFLVLHFRHSRPVWLTRLAVLGIENTRKGYRKGYIARLKGIGGQYLWKVAPRPVPSGPGTSSGGFGDANGCLRRSLDADHGYFPAHYPPHNFKVYRHTSISI